MGTAPTQINGRGHSRSTRANTRGSVRTRGIDGLPLPPRAPPHQTQTGFHYCSKSPEETVVSNQNFFNTKTSNTFGYPPAPLGAKTSLKTEIADIPWLERPLSAKQPCAAYGCRQRVNFFDQMRNPRMVVEAKESMKQTLWVFGPVTCVRYPLLEIEAEGTWGKSRHHNVLQVPVRVERAADTSTTQPLQQSNPRRPNYNECAMSCY